MASFNQHAPLFSDAFACGASLWFVQALLSQQAPSLDRSEEGVLAGRMTSLPQYREVVGAFFAAARTSRPASTAQDLRRLWALSSSIWAASHEINVLFHTLYICGAEQLPEHGPWGEIAEPGDMFLRVALARLSDEPRAGQVLTYQTGTLPMAWFCDRLEAVYRVLEEVEGGDSGPYDGVHGRSLPERICDLLCICYLGHSDLFAAAWVESTGVVPRIEGLIRAEYSEDLIVKEYGEKWRYVFRTIADPADPDAALA